MDKTIRNLIRMRNKEKRTRVLKLSYLRWSACILLLSILLFSASLFTHECDQWLSGVFVSISCGCITGLSFYFLANVRNNKAMKLQKEYNAIKATYDVMLHILGYRTQYRLAKLWREKRDPFEDAIQLQSLIDELELARNNIPLEVYDTVDTLGYDPMDYDNLNSYRVKLVNAITEDKMRVAIEEICKELVLAIDVMKELLEIRQDQIGFMGKYFF